MARSNHLKLVWSERIHRERFEAGEVQPAAQSWRPTSTQHWWLLADLVVGSEGPGAGGRQSWECYEHGRLIAIKHSLLEAKAALATRNGGVRWQRVDLPAGKVQPPFASKAKLAAPTRVWVADL